MGSDNGIWENKFIDIFRQLQDWTIIHEKIEWYIVLFIFFVSHFISPVVHTKVNELLFEYVLKVQQTYKSNIQDIKYP